MASSRSTSINDVGLRELRLPLFILCFVIACLSLVADEGDAQVEYPWLTGPLLSPFGYVIDKGHFNFEPYLYGNTEYGRYDKHWKGHSKHHYNNLTVQPYTWFGFAHRWDIQIGPQFSWNHTSGASHWVVNDLPIELDFQILYERPHRWQPAVKLALLGTIPLGKYQKLNPKDKGTDIGGLGTWDPGAQLVFQRLFPISGEHYLVLHYTIGFTIPTVVHVKGYNVYGGGRHTRGKVYPGPSFSTFSDWNIASREIGH